VKNSIKAGGSIGNGISRRMGRERKGRIHMGREKGNRERTAGCKGNQACPRKEKMTGRLGKRKGGKTPSLRASSARHQCPRAGDQTFDSTKRRKKMGARKIAGSRRRGGQQNHKVRRLQFNANRRGDENFSKANPDLTRGREQRLGNIAVSQKNQKERKD